MGAASSTTGPLAEFAQAHGLEFGHAVELPADGTLLTEDDLTVGDAATGALPGGEPGTLCHLTYTYRSNDTTHTARRTAAVVRVPESIGFAPYLSAGAPLRSLAYRASSKTVKLDGGGSVRAAEGIDEAWLTELLSPAFAEWLARSPDGFEWELADGVLCASSEGHLTKESELVRLCEDAAHIAATVREECLEEVDSGGARRSAARRKRDAEAAMAARMLAGTTFQTPPKDVASTAPQFRHHLARHPSTYFVALFMTGAWMLAINVIGGGIFGLLLNLPNPGLAVLVFELSLLAIVGFLCVRHQINSMASRLAHEGFWREYASGRGLRAEDPATFAATHAKAELPGAPERVLAGNLAGVDGALIVTGTGLKRGDSIAIVAGPEGPVASADLEVSAPGISAAALDFYVERLAGELRTARAPI